MGEVAQGVGQLRNEIGKIQSDLGINTKLARSYRDSQETKNKVQEALNKLMKPGGEGKYPLPSYDYKFSFDPNTAVGRYQMLQNGTAQAGNFQFDPLQRFQNSSAYYRRNSGY